MSQIIVSYIYYAKFTSTDRYAIFKHLATLSPILLTLEIIV